MRTQAKKIELSEGTLEQLFAHRDNLLADYALATKYEHNAHLVPQIKSALNRVTAELHNRGIYAV